VNVTAAQVQSTEFVRVRNLIAQRLHKEAQIEACALSPFRLLASRTAISTVSFQVCSETCSERRPITKSSQMRSCSRVRPRLASRSYSSGLLWPLCMAVFRLARASQFRHLVGLAALIGVDSCLA